MAFLTMVSMGAWSQIDVQITNGGKFDGGSIKYIDQTKPDEKGFVTVTITVIPDKEKGYTISKNDITVVSTYPPSGNSSTRTPEIANNLTLYYNGSAEKDIDDTTAKRDYTFIVPTGFGAWVKEANFQSGGSKGPSRNVTTITSLNQLTTSGSFIITADIDATGYNSLASFTGTLTARPKADGSYPVIRGLRCPLFAKVTDAVISNLIFDDVIISTGDNVGAVAGTADGSSRIYNIGILGGSVGGSGNTGSIIGSLDGTARVINCYSYANITGGTTVGGIVGNNKVATNSSSLKTMIMNCMFYGDISGSSNKAPIYNGQKILNAGTTAVGNYNYYSSDASYVQNNDIQWYYCALMAETRFLQRFEFYRYLLNSHRDLAAWWATGDIANRDMMAKWVLMPSQIGSEHPYPILKAPKDNEDNTMQYPSVINIDAKNAPTTSERNKGGNLGTLTVKIRMGSGGEQFAPPTDAEIEISSLTLNITDKDYDHFNFNYYKVQLPYYNDVGTKNYTQNRVVTGWKIVEINDNTTGTGSFTTDADVTFDANGNIATTPYNFADRYCTNKDLYSVSKRVFNQGAYWDVPDGVSSITIEPYWAKAAYIADANADVVYDTGMTKQYNVPNVGGGQIYTSGESYNINGDNQIVYTTTLNSSNAIEQSAIAKAVTALNINSSHTVNDYAVVLVGNYHQYNNIISDNKPYTVTSVDLDYDNEPDYSFMLRFDSRTKFHPVKYDFLNLVGLGMAQKSTGGKGTYNFGIPQPLYWFEITNTALFRVTQMEYDVGRKASPLILHGGVFEQWVSGQTSVSNATSYFHIGSNVWFKEFHLGCHQDGTIKTKHPPISVTGGDYEKFYLTGLYADASNYEDDAECYINGGRFGTVAGAGMEGIGNASTHKKGNITWQIDNADIDEFYGGGINAKKPVEGNINTIIRNSHVGLFCGGPKFGDMNTDRKVKTTATGCTFDTFFGAGYGGNSYYRAAPQNFTVANDPWKNTGDEKQYNLNWNQWVSGTIKASQKGGNYANGVVYDGYKKQYISAFGGVSVGIDYQFLPMSNNTYNVGRLFLDFVSFSLATTFDVTSNLTGCTITGNFYGGGSLGKVSGPVTSTLNGCTVSGSVYGAGFSASLPTVKIMNTTGFQVEPSYDKETGVYMPATLPAYEPDEYHWKQAATVSSTENAIDNNNHILYTTTDLSALGTVTGAVTLNIGEGTTVAGSVYGGGESSQATGNLEVNINGGSFSNDVFGGGKAGNVGGSVTVNINGGTITKDVYGGGALANTNVKNTTSTSEYITTVNLHNGTINGNVYGGGLGRRANAEQDITAMIALVGGDVNVNLNGTEVDDGQGNKSYPDKCVVKGKIFGCNNLMGTPTGKVKVHVYKTWGDAWTPEEILDDIDDTKHKYHLAAVYGGGNLAAYEPTNAYSTDPATKASAYAHVIIDGCAMTSIRQVYGGGNAASTPATKVDVNGTYEIEELFGGGNGKDDLPDGSANPGANVGFKNYSAVENEYDTREKRQQEFFVNNYTYGSGQAEVNMYGGLVHRIYGGSNTKGNVRIVAVTMLDEQSGCAFNVEQAYGGGKSAPMDGRAELKMACVPGLKVAYGGAEEADIQNDVILNLTNGNFDRVFGGNNVNGTIHGKITVNIEETGCHLISIGQLYGGGNQAPYIGPLENGTRVGPTINVKSFSSIGEIYGGGYGKTAVVTGDTHVNINVCKGKDFGDSEETEANRVNQHTHNGEEQTISFSQFKRNDDPSTGYFVLDENGHRVVEDKTETVTLPKFVPGKIGAITNVYGGGNEAQVIGNTYVNIGTQSTVDFETGSGNADPQTGVQVKGVDIRGNVYGGGNQANVTGKTNVVIGRKETPASPARASEPPSESQPVTP